MEEKVCPHCPKADFIVAIFSMESTSGYREGEPSARAPPPQRKPQWHNY